MNGAWLRIRKSIIRLGQVSGRRKKLNKAVAVHAAVIEDAMQSAVVEADEKVLLLPGVAMCYAVVFHPQLFHDQFNVWSLGEFVTRYSDRISEIAEHQDKSGTLLAVLLVMGTLGTYAIEFVFEHEHIRMESAEFFLERV